jgi:hypothetical protein
MLTDEQPFASFTRPAARCVSFPTVNAHATPNRSKCDTRAVATCAREPLTIALFSRTVIRPSATD